MRCGYPARTSPSGYLTLPDFPESSDAKVGKGDIVKAQDLLHAALEDRLRLGMPIPQPCVPAQDDLIIWTSKVMGRRIVAIWEGREDPGKVPKLRITDSR